jgi:cobalt-zinc-cadmium efflux system outer membrane protein
LGPGYEYSQGQNLFLLLPAADLPIFNQNQGPIAEAVARREEVAARFTSLQTQIIDAIDGAYASYRAADRALGTANRLLADEQDRERLILQAFEAGQIDRPALVTARIERLAAQQSQFDATVQQRQALGALEDALQRSFFAPTAALPVLQTNPRRHSEPSP